MSSQLRSCTHTRVRAARPAPLGRASVPRAQRPHNAPAATRLRFRCACGFARSALAAVDALRVIAARRCASLASGPAGSPARGPRFYLNCLT